MMKTIVASACAPILVSAAFVIITPAHAQTDTGVKTAREVCQRMIDTGYYDATHGECVGDFNNQMPELCSQQKWRDLYEILFAVEIKTKGDCIRVLREWVRETDFNEALPE